MSWLESFFSFAGKGLWKVFANRFSIAELDLLRAAALKGELLILHVEHLGDWVRVEKKDFIDERDPAVAARYREALMKLTGRGLVHTSEGRLFRLTGTGFDLARKCASTTPPVMSASPLSDR